jgi:arylsulfatase A-like enzyme
MERRTTALKAAYLGLAIAGLAALSCSRDGEGGASAPQIAGLSDGGRAAGFNLVLISVDTLRADRLGCYGRAGAQTPRIDGLAATGLRFDQVTSSVPLTLPSHATMLTGLAPPEHGVRINGTFRLGDEQVTLAERLRDAGYATAAFIGAFVLDSRYGLAQGFEHYDDSVDPRPLEHPTVATYNERSAADVIDAAIGWLDDLEGDNAAAPFFAFLHLFDPHAPYAPPEEYLQRFPSDPYQGEVAYVDSEIGRLIDALSERGRLDRTLIVLVSDHGEGLGDHGELTHGDLIYDSTMRVPWIVSNPSLFPVGVVVDDRVAGLVDLYPTLLGLLGVSAGGGPRDGIDLFSAAPQEGRSIYIEALAPLLDYGWAPLFGLRRLDDKYIQAPTPEYYALREDPGELVNLHDGNREALRLEERLASRMEAWPSPLEVIDLEQGLTPEEEERLAALGYVRPPERPDRIGVKDPKEMMPLWRRMQEAGEASLRGEHRQAGEAIQAVLREDPSSAKGWYAAVRIFDRAGDYARAELSVRRALELSPRVEGWIILARYALNRGDRETFQSALAAAERLDPRDGGIYIGRGHALAMDGKYEAAREQFLRAIEVDPVRSGQHARQQIQRLDSMGGGE